MQDVLKDTKFKLALILNGASSVIFQSVMLRLFLGIFEGNEFVITVLLSFWLLWPALGSGIFAVLFKPSFSKLSRAVLFSAVFVFVSGVFVVLTRKVWGLWPGEEMGILPMFLWILVLLAPFGLLHGLLFYLFIGIAEQKEKSSLVYLFDSAGDLAGGALFGYFLVNIFSSFESGYIIIFILFAIFIIFSFNLKIPERIVSFSFVFLFSIFIIFYGKKFERFIYRVSWSPQKIVEFFSTRYGDYAVVKSGGEYAFFSNSELMFYYPDPLSVEERVHPVMLQRNERGDVLLISGGVSGIIKEVKKYNPFSIDYLELDKRFVEKVKRYLSTEDKRAMEDVNFFSEDAIRFLKKERKKYLFVLMLGAEPKTLSASRYYTVEFFKLLKERLRKNGVVGFWISGGEYYISDEKRDYLASIKSTAKMVFKNILVVPGEKTLFLVSDSPLVKMPEKLIKRMENKGIETYSLSPGVIYSMFLKERMEWIKETLKKEGRINSSFEPVSSYFYITLFGKKHSRIISSFFRKVSSLNFLFLIIPLIFLNLFFNFLKRRKFVMFSVAFVSTALELVTILGFEMIHGYVYNLYGIVVASFMFGIVGGTWFVRRINRSLDLYAVLYLILFPWLVFTGMLFLKGRESEILFQILFPFLNFLSGIPVGVCYASLAKKIAIREERGGSVLYALDMLGGMAGTLISGLFLIPLFGMVKTIVFLSLVSLSSLAGFSR